MSSDMDIVFQEENDWRRMEDTLDVQQEMMSAAEWEFNEQFNFVKRVTEQAEMMRDQADTDNAVLNRVKRGETTQWDYFYLRARLSVRD